MSSLTYFCKFTAQCLSLLDKIDNFVDCHAEGQNTGGFVLRKPLVFLLWVECVVHSLSKTVTYCAGYELMRQHTSQVGQNASQVFMTGFSSYADEAVIHEILSDSVSLQLISVTSWPHVTQPSIESCFIT